MKHNIKRTSIKLLKSLTILQLFVIVFSSCTSSKFINKHERFNSKDFQIEGISGINEKQPVSGTTPMITENEASAVATISEYTKNTVAENQVTAKSVKQFRKNNSKNLFSQVNTLRKINQILPLNTKIDLVKSNVAGKTAFKDDGRKTSGMALAGFILGLVGWFIPLLGIILSILAIIFSAIGLYQILTKPERYKGLGFAIAGLALGVIGSLIILIFLAAL